VTVTVLVPVAALLPIVIFIVEVPAPVMEVGVKVIVLAEPSPVADNVMAESKPPVTVEVMVTEPEALRSMVIDVGEALMLKPDAVAVMVRETLVVSTVLPDVPVTVMP
jgi:hypothetical protein